MSPFEPPQRCSPRSRDYKSQQAKRREAGGSFPSRSFCLLGVVVSLAVLAGGHFARKNFPGSLRRRRGTAGLQLPGCTAPGAARHFVGCEETGIRWRRAGPAVGHPPALWPRGLRNGGSGPAALPHGPGAAARKRGKNTSNRAFFPHENTRAWQQCEFRGKCRLYFFIICIL